MPRPLRLPAASAEAATSSESLPRFANRSGAFVGAVNLSAQIVDRLLAFVQIAVIAAAFGATANADMYFLASIVPLALASTIGEPIGRAALTLLIRSDRDDVVKVAGAGALLTLAVFTVLTAAYLALALPLVHVFGIDHARGFAPWLAFAFIAPAMGFSGYLTSLLLWGEQYVWAAVRLPLSTLAGTLFLVVAVRFTHEMEWIAASIAGGYVLGAAILYGVVSARLGPGWLLRSDRGARRAVFRLRRKVLGPAVSGIVSGQAIIIIERALAAALQPGAVATVSYARGIAGAPSTVGFAVGSAAYPRLARAEAAGSTAYLRDNFIRGLRIALFVGAAFVAYLAIYADDLIGSLLQRGEFGSGTSDVTAHLLALFALAALTGSLVSYLVQVLYGINAFGAILWFEVSIFVVYIVLAVALRHAFGIDGLPLAFGLAQLVGVASALTIIGFRLGISALELVRAAVLPLLGRLSLLVAMLLGFKLTADYVGVALAARGVVYVGGGTALLVILVVGLFLSAPLPEAQALREAAARRARGM